MMNSITKNKLILLGNKLLKIIFITFVILSIWELFALIVNDSFFLPDVIKTAAALKKIFLSNDFSRVVLTAVYRVSLGLILGIIIGITLATLCYKIHFLNDLFSPIISIIKATPVACIIVLLWIRFNYTQIAVLIVILMVTPIISQNVYDGYNSIDNDLYEVTLIFELSTVKKIRVLIIPSLLSYLLPAIITSVGLAWKAEIAAEIMTNSNIGRLIFDYKTVTYDTASIFAWTTIIIFFSILFEKGAKYLLGRILNELNN